MNKTIYMTRKLHQCSDHYEKASGVNAFLEVGAPVVFEWLSVNPDI